MSSADTDPLISLSGNIDCQDNYLEFKAPEGFSASSFAKFLLELSGDGFRPDGNMTVRNNRFKNFPVNRNFIKFTNISSRDECLDIADNKLINNIGASSAEVSSTFTHTLTDRSTGLYGDAKLYMGLLKNASVDYKLFEDAVYEAGGALTTAERAGLAAFINGVYTAGLRDKMVIFNPVVGGGNGYLVPIWGWEISGVNHGINTHRRHVAYGGLSATDYIAAIGIVGDGLTKSISVARLADLDLTDFGFGFQLTQIGGISNRAYFAYYNDIRINKDGSTLKGLYGGTLKSSYAPSVGFVHQGRNSQGGTAIGGGLVDTIAHPNTSAGSTAGGLITNTTHALNRFSLMGKGGPATTENSNDGYGAYWITKHMDDAQIATFRTLVRSLMVAIGRPVQL